MEKNERTAQRLIKALDARTQLDKAIQDCVLQLRHAGISWDNIGGLLGVSKQAAWDKYAREATAGAPSATGTPTEEAPADND